MKKSMEAEHKEINSISKKEKNAGLKSKAPVDCIDVKTHKTLLELQDMSS